MNRPDSSHGGVQTNLRTAAPDPTNAMEGISEGGPRACAPSEGMLTKQDLASFFKVTTRTIDAWMASGKISYYRIGRSIRFRLSDIWKDLQAKRIGRAV